MYKIQNPVTKIIKIPQVLYDKVVQKANSEFGFNFAEYVRYTLAENVGRTPDDEEQKYYANLEKDYQKIIANPRAHKSFANIDKMFEELDK